MYDGDFGGSLTSVYLSTSVDCEVVGWGYVAGLCGMAWISNSLDTLAGITAAGGCCLSLTRVKSPAVNNKLYELKHESGK